MTKGERISQFVQELEGASPAADEGEIAQHPCYRGFFRCWNEQRYDFDVAGLVRLLKENMGALVASELTRNPWSPETAPRLAQD